MHKPRSALSLTWPLPAIVASVAVGLIVAAWSGDGSLPPFAIWVALSLVFVAPLAILGIVNGRRIRQERSAGLSRALTGSTAREIAADGVAVAGGMVRAVKWLAIGLAVLLCIVAAIKGLWWLASAMWQLI